jgi:hypothetical protein
VRPDSAQQLLEVDGLLKVFIRMHAIGALLAIMYGGHADHWNVRIAHVGELSLAEFVTGHHRHHQVEENHGGTRLVEAAERFRTVAGSRHVEPFALEQDCEHLAKVNVILDDEDDGQVGIH